MKFITRRSKNKLRKKRIYDLVGADDRFVMRGTAYFAKKRGLWRRVVHIFVFNRQGELLICKRPSWAKSYPNLITSSAGGKVDLGETYLFAARRELKEELGITPLLKEIGGYGVKTKKHGKILHKLFVAHANRVYPNKKEIAEVCFVTIKKLSRDIKHHPKKFILPFLRAFRLYSATHRLPK